MQGPHALVILSVLLTAGLLFAIKRREASDDAGGAALAAAGLFLIFSTTWHDYDALAANCELFLLPFQAGAAWMLLGELGGRPSRGARALATHLAVGLLIGTSALFKYQGLTFLGASIGMLGWSAIIGRASWRRAAAMAGCQVIGALVPAALYLLWCAAAGNAADAIYWFRFNFSYVNAGLTGLAAIGRGLRRTLLIGGVALVPYALGLAAAAGAARGAWRACSAGGCGARARSTPTSRRPSVVLALLWLATSAVAVAAGGRFFGHYFHLVLAPLCLLAAPEFCRLWKAGLVAAGAADRAVRAAGALLLRPGHRRPIARGGPG